MEKIDLKSHEIVRAARVYTMAPDDLLLSDGALLSDGSTIQDIGTFADLSRAYPQAAVRDLGDVALVPGLINAHCHLELSAMRGALDPGLGFMEWLRQLIRHPKRQFDKDTPKAIVGALSEMRRSGVCFVGDISTHNVEAVAGTLMDSGFFFACFREHILFDVPGGDEPLIPAGEFERGFYSGAAHAPYSTHAETMQMVKQACRDTGLPFSLHLAEIAEETDALMGRSTWYTDMLERIGLSHEGFTAPNCSPVQFADKLGLLDQSTLAVHCVTVDDDDISTLAASGAGVCLCPRSNEFITGGRAPWEKLMAAGVPCCLGTDSLASNHDLNLWNELRFMKERWQGELSLMQGLAMMTINPAGTLGLSGLGSLAPGKAARCAIIPPDVEAMFR